MKRNQKFHALPPVPETYKHLKAFTAAELMQAYNLGYIEKNGQTKDDVDCDYDTITADDMKDWRTRFSTVWFCFVFENLLNIEHPSYAIEELILELKATDIIDVLNRRLATLYAGAGGSPVPDLEKRKQDHLWLQPHYDFALSLLNKWHNEN